MCSGLFSVPVYTQNYPKFILATYENLCGPFFFLDYFSQHPFERNVKMRVVSPTIILNRGDFEYNFRSQVRDRGFAQCGVDLTKFSEALNADIIFPNCRRVLYFSFATLPSALRIYVNFFREFKFEEKLKIQFVNFNWILIFSFERSFFF